MVSLPDIPSDSALVRLFEQPSVRDAVTWFALPGGAVLFEPGEAADQLFLVRAGRLGAFRHDEGREPEFIGVIRPGEPVGEMALIAGQPHSARVVALRDSEIFAVPRQVFFAAADERPEVMTELARLMLARTRQTSVRLTAGEPRVFGFVNAGDPMPLRPLVERVADAIGALGYAVEVLGAEAAKAPTEWYSEVERRHDFVLYVAEAGDLAWRAAVVRQVDRLFRVGQGDRKPPPAPAAVGLLPLVDLVLVQPPGIARPRGSAAWVEALSPARVFHVRQGRDEDHARLARVITGQSVGLVLSGGGARAYAQVGAVRALRGRHVPIDFVCGASMGAIVAAGVALGWSDLELDARIRKAFVDSSPLDDIAFPIRAMTHGRKVRQRLEEHFGDVDIADLWLPWFCVSSNLTTGAYQLHRRGRLVDALRASSALPGLLPPMVDGDNVLVDGAVLKNFPADLMRGLHLGPIVGVDVTRGRSITAKDIAGPDSVWRWLAGGAWRKGPPIVSLLMRAATVSAGQDYAAAREATDLLIAPDMSEVEIRDWEAYDPAVAEGYRAAVEALDALTRPVIDLRRRASLLESATKP